MPADDEELLDLYELLQDGLEAYAAGDSNELAHKARMAKELVQGLYGEDG